MWQTGQGEPTFLPGIRVSAWAFEESFGLRFAFLSFGLVGALARCGNPRLGGNSNRNAAQPAAE